MKYQGFLLAAVVELAVSGTCVASGAFDAVNAKADKIAAQNQAGLEKSFNKGYDKGYQQGRKQVLDKAYNKGRKQVLDKAYNEAYNKARQARIEEIKAKAREEFARRQAAANANAAAGN